MSGYLHHVGKLLYDQSGGTYGDDPTPATYMPLIDGKPDLSGVRSMYFEKGTMKQGIYGEPGVVGHASESTLSTPHWLHGLSSSTPTKGPAAIHPDAEWAAMAFGNALLWDAGSEDTLEEATGFSDTVTIDMANDPAVAGFVSGEIITVQTVNGWESGVIKTVNAAPTNTLVLRAPLSSATIGADKTVFSGTTVYPAIAWGLEDMACTVAGHASQDFLTLLGGRPTSYKITANPRDFARVDVEWVFNSEERAGAGGAPAATSWSYAARQEVMGGELILYDGVSRVALDCSTFELDLGLEVVQPLDPAGSNGIGDPILVNRKPVIRVNPKYTSTVRDGGTFDPNAAFAAGTQFDLRYAWGKPGSRCCITFAAAQLIEEPQPADRNNLSSWPLVFEAMGYTDDTGSAVTTDADFGLGFN